jgi:TonB-dependent receptor
MMMRKLVLIGILSLMAGITYAQDQARIFGVVSEKASGEALIGTNVIIEGTTIGVSADLDGSYSLKNLKPGTYTIQFSYIGFTTEVREVILAAGDVLELNVEMDWQGVTGEQVMVTAQARGQMSAINQQRSSNRITNVVSSDRIQELPDVNAAESIGRLPGIAIQRSGGEANKIAIRGLSPKFNTVTVNGVRMPSVDTQERSIDLSLVASNMLDGIEVTKALTADQDADAIGGTVDLRLRTAPETLLVDVQASGGYTRLQDTYSNYKLSGSTGWRMFEKKLGVIIGLNADQFDRSADQFSGGYELIPDPQNSNTLTPNVNSLNLRENALTRSRKGGNFLIDYRIPRGEIVWNTFYNFLRNETDRRENNFNIGSLRHTYSLNKTLGDAAIFTTSLNVEKEWDFASVDLGGAYTSSFNEHPEDYYWNFMEESAIDGADRDAIKFNAPELVPPFFKNNLENTYFDGMSINRTETEENEASFFGNVQIPFRVGLNVDGYLKVGGKFRRFNRTHDREQIGLNIYYGGGQDARNILAEALPELGLETGMNRLPLEAFQDDYTRSNFLNGDFPIGYTLDSEKLLPVIDVLRDYFYYNGQNSLGNDYEGYEEYSAAYAMSEINIGRFITLIPGVRYEEEYTDYTAKFVLGTEDRPVDAGGGIPSTVAYRDTTSSRSADFLLPMLHMQIKPADWINLRLAYTETLSRPSFRQFAPITFVSRFGDWMNAPNTNLLTSRSVNYDASLSIFRNKLGFFTVSGFYKEIHDLIWFVTFPLLEGQTILPEINIPNITGVPRVNTHLNNTYLATVKGVEFDWQTNFWYLPSFLKGLVLNVNYTVLESETEYPQFRREQVPIEPRPPRPPFFNDVIVDTSRVGRMPDQPNSILNVTLGYDYKGFSIRASYLYQSDILRGLATNPENDRFTEDYVRFDLSIRQQLPGNLQLFANLNNLNNRADRNYQSSIGNYPTFIEYYGFTMDLGVRYKF